MKKDRRIFEEKLLSSSLATGREIDEKDGALI